MYSHDVFIKGMPPICLLFIIHSVNTEYLLCTKHWKYESTRQTWRSPDHSLCCVPALKWGNLYSNKHLLSFCIAQGHIFQPRLLHTMGGRFPKGKFDTQRKKFGCSPAKNQQLFTPGPCHPATLPTFLEVLKPAFPHSPWNKIETSACFSRLIACCSLLTDKQTNPSSSLYRPICGSLNISSSYIPVSLCKGIH